MRLFFVLLNSAFVFAVRIQMAKPIFLSFLYLIIYTDLLVVGLLLFQTCFILYSLVNSLTISLGEFFTVKFFFALQKVYQTYASILLGNVLYVKWETYVFIFFRSVGKRCCKYYRYR